MTRLRIWFENEQAKPPVYAHFDDACMDIFCVDTVVVPAKGFLTLETGVRYELPENWELQVRSKSGLADRAGVFVLNSPGTVDEGYRLPGQTLRVVIGNIGDADYTFNQGDKLAQITPNPVYRAEVVVMNPEASLYTSPASLGAKQLRAGGFGSTGK